VGFESLVSGSTDTIKASYHQKSSTNEKVKSGCHVLKFILTLTHSYTLCFNQISSVDTIQYWILNSLQCLCELIDYVVYCLYLVKINRNLVLEISNSVWAYYKLSTASIVEKENEIMKLGQDHKTSFPCKPVEEKEGKKNTVRSGISWLVLDWDSRS